MNNLPSVKIGVVAVSRDCFPISLSERRRDSLVAAYTGRYGEIVKIPTIIAPSYSGQRQDNAELS